MSLTDLPELMASRCVVLRCNQGIEGYGRASYSLAKDLNLLSIRVWERRASRRQEVGAAHSRHRREGGHRLDLGVAWQAGAQAGA